MSCVKRLKIIFSKENFDYSQGQVDPFKFHRTFYYLCKIYRVLEKEDTPRWTILTPILSSILGCSALTLAFLTFIHYVQSFRIPEMTEAGTYFILVSHKLLIIVCSVTGKDKYHKCFRAMRDDFKFICTKGSKYREKFFINHLWTWKASVLIAIFLICIAVGMILCSNMALIFFLLYPPESGERPLPFPFYIHGVDLSKSPMYEIIFWFFNTCVCSYDLECIFMLTTQIVWIRQITSKADVIVWSIEDLLVDVHPTNNVEEKEYYEKIIKARIADIIKMHNSMFSLLEDYSAVYKKLLMYEQKLCGPVVCLTAYVAIEKLDAGEFHGIMFLMCIATIILVLIPSYLCTILGEKVQSIKDALWNTPFWNAPGNVICPYFILIMQRSERPLPIQAPGFEEVSLKTFGDKMKFAYSGFNMLRQVNYEI